MVNFFLGTLEDPKGSHKKKSDQERHFQGSGPAGRAAGLAAQPLLQSSSGIPMNVLCEFHLSTFSVVHQWGNTTQKGVAIKKIFELRAENRTECSLGW